MTNPADHLLAVRNLRTHFHTEDGVVPAVDGVSFDVPAGKTFALVGESGCGKSVTAFTIMGLVPCPPGRIESGSIQLLGEELIGLGEPAMRAIRGRQIGMIFQEPMTSLNPVYTVGSQVAEAILLHADVSRAEARQRTVELFEQVGISAPHQRYDAYPHQLSGGMRQRVMIAMALSCSPKLLIADEPTTALDVTIQDQILELLRDIQADTNLGMMLITHDLAVVAENAHHVAVMYASKIVEQSPAAELFSEPLHPYTCGLLRSIPNLGQNRHRLDTIPGSVPNPLHFPPGCHFHPRCDLTRRKASQADPTETTLVNGPNGPERVLTRCATCEPELRAIRPGHCAACWETPGYDRAAPAEPTPAP
jgi:oligopeptide/dipeptide ABC transporter ATP-binding protein